MVLGLDVPENSHLDDQSTKPRQDLDEKNPYREHQKTREQDQETIQKLGKQTRQKSFEVAHLFGYNAYSMRHSRKLFVEVVCLGPLLSLTNPVSSSWPASSVALAAGELLLV